MAWFFIVLFGALLYACTNHIDKYLISRYLQDGRVGALIIFSSIFSIFALPIIALIYHEVLNVSLVDGAILAFNGILVVLAILCYFYAIKRDEASVVVPFYQTIPIFGFVLGYIILGEVITAQQMIAALLIIIGALILSLRLDAGRISFKKAVVFFMLVASLFYAINGVIFKLIALDIGFWPSIFWGLVGKVIVGCFFLFFIRQYRDQFFTMIRKNRVAILSINSSNETISIIAEGVTQYALLLAPVVLVLLVGSFQPLFVFLIGIILTLFFPYLGRESIVNKDIIQRILGIVLVVLGSYFIFK